MAAWLLTSTTYGTWLPGDRRGSVTSVRDYRVEDPATKSRIEHSRPGEAYEPPIDGLRRSAVAQMRGPMVLLNSEHAEILLAAFRDTASRRHWRLLAISIMRNHVHIVVATSDEVVPSELLQKLKAYGSRSLSEHFGKPESGTWWTKHGSKRHLPDSRAIEAAINYVLHRQPNPLVTWSPNQRHD